METLYISDCNDGFDEDGHGFGQTNVNTVPNGAANGNTHPESDLCPAQNPYYGNENEEAFQAVNEGIIRAETTTITNNIYYE